MDDTKRVALSAEVKRVSRRLEEIRQNVAVASEDLIMANKKMLKLAESLDVLIKELESDE